MVSLLLQRLLAMGLESAAQLVYDTLDEVIVEGLMLRVCLCILASPKL